eukprot:4657198-Pyramimonas_sp.AAC.1
MRSQEGALGRTEGRIPSDHNEKGDSSVDSVTRSREQHSSGRYGTAKTSAEGPSELVRMFDHILIDMSGAESLGAQRAVQYTLYGESED